MFFSIDTANGVPVYEQISRQIMFAIASGGIPVGEMVPSVRILSREMAVNPNTVARAYRQLQDQNILETVRGSGLRVAGKAPQKCIQARKKLIQIRIDKVLIEARQSQLSDEEIQAMVDQGLKNSRPRKQER